MFALLGLCSSERCAGSCVGEHVEQRLGPEVDHRPPQDPLMAAARHRAARGRHHRARDGRGRRAVVVDTRPDIIVIYLDDVNPHDARLWSDPGRTPTMTELFVDTATTFETSIGETPLCCPGRAGTLTGLHTSNHGVDENDVGLFDPSVTLATETPGRRLSDVLRGQVHEPAAPARASCRDAPLRRRLGRIRCALRGQRTLVRLRPVDAVGYAPPKPQGRDHITLMTERRAAKHLREASSGCTGASPS